MEEKNAVPYIIHEGCLTRDDELMTTLQVINPRLYNSVIRKL